MTSCTLGVAVVKSDFVVNGTERRTNESGVSTFEMLQIMVELLCGDQVDMREEEEVLRRRETCILSDVPSETLTKKVADKSLSYLVINEYLFKHTQ